MVKLGAQPSLPPPRSASRIDPSHKGEGYCIWATASLSGLALLGHLLPAGEKRVRRGRRPPLPSGRGWRGRSPSRVRGTRIRVKPTCDFPAHKGEGLKVGVQKNPVVGVQGRTIMGAQGIIPQMIMARQVRLLRHDSRCPQDAVSSLRIRRHRHAWGKGALPWSRTGISLARGDHAHTCARSGLSALFQRTFSSRLSRHGAA